MEVEVEILHGGIAYLRRDIKMKQFAIIVVQAEKVVELFA